MESCRLQGGGCLLAATYSQVQPLLLPCSQTLPRIQENLDTGKCMSYRSVFKYCQLVQGAISFPPPVKQDVSVVWIGFRTMNLWLWV